MAVVYMRKLEEEPDTYEERFTSLTKGINLEVYEWILENVNSTDAVLEVGCGPGTLSYRMAKKGAKVQAIDKSEEMISQAKKTYLEKEAISINFDVASSEGWSIPEVKYDKIVSTFMLSELRPFEQQIFLRNIWQSLKNNGKLLIAAEFVPENMWKVPFNIKRWWYRKKLGRLKKSTNPLKWFKSYLEPIGFKINSIKAWNHGAIQVMEIEKVTKEGQKEPGYYRPKRVNYKGLKSQLKIYRCIFTGQVDKVPIEPGIYQSGESDETSPIIVTANYVFTYIKVMRALEGTDAWVLCLDSNGINVWCAARGGDFENKQLLEVVKATDIENITEKRMLILPQLSAGGVDSRVLPMNSEEFPFKIKYGPIWAEYLKEYLEEKPKRKPLKMRLAKFSLSHRIRAGVTHITFLLRKIFSWPLLGLLLLFLILGFINTSWFSKLWSIPEILFWVVFSNAVISIFFPLSKFTRKFIIKGIFFGIINVVLLGIFTWFLRLSVLYVILSIVLQFWIAFFSTMSFSGYTMSTDPKEIQEEYLTFRKINIPIMILGIILYLIGVIFF
ncbi:MAG: methyltransferase domain-containing protein [Candidatus Lokiarchaeota archaeon]